MFNCRQKADQTREVNCGPGQTLYPRVDHRTGIHCCIELRPFLGQWEVWEVVSACRPWRSGRLR